MRLRRQEAIALEEREFDTEMNGVEQVSYMDRLYWLFESERDEEKDEEGNERNIVEMMRVGMSRKKR